MPLVRTAYLPHMVSMIDRSKQALLAIADLYEDAVERLGGRSLARVATVVVNRGSFFTALRRGSTCSLQNYDRLMDCFADPETWPESNIPPSANEILASYGRPAPFDDCLEATNA